MVAASLAAGYRLDLRAGEWVEVRSAQEILDTLDPRGRLDGLPFMPEMLQYCGQRFRVYKSAHKTCDTVATYGNRYLPGTVHLEGLRCDGSAHGDCQAHCLLYWKEAWLKRVPARAVSFKYAPVPARNPASAVDLATLLRETRQPAGDAELYACQATAIPDASIRLRWYDPRHYLKDLTSRNVTVAAFARYVGYAAARAFLRHLGHDPARRPGRAVPGATAARSLGLQPGERVRVRSRKEIYETIDRSRKNRGLWYDIEMEPFSGKNFSVLTRVERLIDEKTGKMLKLGDCVILDAAVCSGCRSTNRMFCPRSIYPFWREAWLERCPEAPEGDAARNSPAG